MLPYRIAIMNEESENWGVTANAPLHPFLFYCVEGNAKIVFTFPFFSKNGWKICLQGKNISKFRAFRKQHPG